MFHKSRRQGFIINGRKIKNIIQFVALKFINFQFSALSDKARPSFQIEFVLERLD